MKRILQPIVGIISYAIALYVMQYFGLLWGIEFDYEATSIVDKIIVYLFVGGVFRIGFTLVRSVLRIVTTPLRWLSLGIVGWIINIVVLYVCQFLIYSYLTGVEMHITSLVGMLISSFVLGFVASSTARILRKFV